MVQTGPTPQSWPVTGGRGSVIQHNITARKKTLRECSEYQTGDSLEKRFKNVEFKKLKKRLIVGMFFTFLINRHSHGVVLRTRNISFPV